MKPEIKSTIIGVSMVLISAVIVAIGIIVATTFDRFVGAAIAIAGTIPWGWACFAEPRFYEKTGI